MKLTVKKLTLVQKISIPFIFNIFLFAAIFSLRLLGLTPDIISIILTAIVSLEIIYLAIFIQISVNKNTESLQEVEKQIATIKEDEERVHTVLIYSRHQMKAMQQELDILRKGSYVKNGNGHHKARA